MLWIVNVSAVVDDDLSFHGLSSSSFWILCGKLSGDGDGGGGGGGGANAKLLTKDHIWMFQKQLCRINYTQEKHMCGWSKYVYYYGNQLFHSMDFDNRTREEWCVKTSKKEFF